MNQRSKLLRHLMTCCTGSVEVLAAFVPTVNESNLEAKGTPAAPATSDESCVLPPVPEPLPCPTLAVPIESCARAKGERATPQQPGQRAMMAVVAGGVTKYHAANGNFAAK